MSVGLDVGVKFGTLSISQRAQEYSLLTGSLDGSKALVKRYGIRVTLSRYLLRGGSCSVILGSSFLGSLGFGFKSLYIFECLAVSALHPCKLFAGMSQVLGQFLVGGL